MPWQPNISHEGMLRIFEDLEREDKVAKGFTKDELIILIPRLGSYPKSCLFPMSSHLVCLILVGNFMTSIEASPRPTILYSWWPKDL
jgi:dihydroxyacetone kinase